MLMKDPKKSIAMILASGPKKPDVPEGDQDDSSMALDSAAEELVSAIHAKDTKGVVSALKSFMDMCDDDDSEQPESEPEQE